MRSWTVDKFIQKGLTLPVETPFCLRVISGFLTAPYKANPNSVCNGIHNDSPFSTVPLIVARTRCIRSARR